MHAAGELKKYILQRSLFIRLLRLSSKQIFKYILSKHMGKDNNEEMQL